MEDKGWKAAMWNTSWNELEENKYSEQGFCSFSNERGIDLEIPFGDITQSRQLREKGVYEWGFSEEHYDNLYGLTQDGVFLVLSNVVSNGVGSSAPGGNYETLRANTLFASKFQFDPCKEIVSVDFEIEGICEWVGLRYEPHIDGEMMCIEKEGVSKAIELFSTEDTRIELRYGIRPPRLSGDELRASSFAYIHIDYANGAALDDAWVTSITRTQSLFAFFFGSYPQIEWMQVQFEGDAWKVDVYRPGFPSAFRYSRTKVPVAFPSDESCAISEVSAAWFNMAGDELYATNVLTSLNVTWDMPFSLKLIAANTMLEALMRARNSEELISKDDLKAIRDALEDVVPEDICERACGLLGLLKKPSYAMLLDSAYDESGPWGQKLIPNWKAFKSEQGVLRNSGAHGRDGGDDYEVLLCHYHAQIVLAYVIVMQRLGLSEDAINKFWDSNFLNVARWRIAIRYALSD